VNAETIQEKLVIYGYNDTDMNYATARTGFSWEHDDGGILTSWRPKEVTTYSTESVTHIQEEVRWEN